MMNILVAFVTALSLYSINAIYGLILPMTKTDGSLDVTSLLSRIALLEQSLENKASAAEVVQLKDDLAKSKEELKSAQTKITVLETKLDQCSCSSPGTQNSASPSELKTLQTVVGHLKQGVFQLQSLHNRTSGSSLTGGSTFTRWGKTSCPADSSIVYKGYTGGSWYDEKGGSSSVVCLSEDPIFTTNTTNHTLNHQEVSGHVFGSEYQTSYSGNPFQHLNDDDIPCVVCESSRSSSVMIPGRNQCYPGWTLEYWGYLMGGYPSYASADYICVDSEAEAIPGGEANDNGQIFVVVESKCGSLPCPPYIENREVSCVVCSK